MPTCPICTSSTVAEILPAKEMTSGTREVFHYAVCESCGSAYNTQFPSDIGRYYADYYSLASDHALPIEMSRIKRAFIGLYAWVAVRGGFHRMSRGAFRCPMPWEMQFLSPNLQAFLFLGAKAGARILDVGSGAGEFVKMMRRFGYARATGIDPFLTGDNEYARRGELADANGTWDAILFNHSLEHMTDLPAAITKSATLLAPGGSVVVHIPNLDSREFAAYKKDWAWMHAPFHFAIPSRRGLEAMAKRAGLRVVDAICTSRGDHYLYSEEYKRGIGDRDPQSARRQLEAGTFDVRRYRALAKRAYLQNLAMTGDWIAYYLKR